MKCDKPIRISYNLLGPMLAIHNKVNNQDITLFRGFGYITGATKDYINIALDYSLVPQKITLSRYASNQLPEAKLIFDALNKILMEESQNTAEIMINMLETSYKRKS